MKQFFNIKKLVTMMLVFTMMIILSACGSKNDNADKNGSDTKEQTQDSNSTKSPVDSNDEMGSLSGTINITGSTSVEKILMDMKSDFEAYNPDVTINYTGTGSSAGISDAMNGANDIGASSRNLKEEEAGLEQVVFAYDGIAVVVHPSNNVADLSIDQLLKIYSGEITNWSEVDGNDAGIIVVSRESASGTRGAFEELTGLEDVGLVDSATVVEGNGNVQATVAGNENAIGYVSFSFINETVKAITIDGVEATAENAKAGTYVLSRPFLLVYNKDTVTPQASAFLEYVVSPDAQIFVEDHGGIRVD